MADVEQAGLEVISGCFLIFGMVVVGIVGGMVALIVKLSKPRDADPRGDLPNAWPPPPKHDDEV